MAAERRQTTIRRPVDSAQGRWPGRAPGQSQHRLQRRHRRADRGERHVHWRYAPDITKRSFTDFRAAYNAAGTPAPFYADYADENFTIHADGKVVRTVKNGCYRLDEWNDPRNQIEQTLQLGPEGIRETALRPAQLSQAPERPVTGSPVKSGRTKNLIRHWRFDEGAGVATTEKQSSKACDIGGVEAYWRPGVSGTCLSFDSYSSVVTLPAAQCPNLEGEFTVSAWIAIQEYPFNLAAIVDHMDGNKGYLLGVNAKGQVEFKIGNGDAVQSVITERVPLYEWVHVAAVAKSGAAAVVYLNGKPVVTATNASAFVDATNADLSIGMTRSVRQFPQFAERAVTKQFQTTMVFSGLIDEVQLFDKALSESEVNTEHAALKPSEARPLKPWVLPAGPEASPGFRAEYTKLRYSPEWDGLWRVGDFADIVVTFADKPWRYVFWRGTRYLPSLVTAPRRGGIWSNDQGPERYDGKEGNASNTCPTCSAGFPTRGSFIAAPRAWWCIGGTPRPRSITAGPRWNERLGDLDGRILDDLSRRHFHPPPVGAQQHPTSRSTLN